MGDIYTKTVFAKQWTGINEDELFELMGPDRFDPHGVGENDDDPEATASFRDDHKGGSWRPLCNGDWVLRDDAGDWHTDSRFAATVVTPDFGFVVRRHGKYDWTADQPVREIVPGMWEVHLPHQCQTWDIAGEGHCEGEPHADAVVAMAAFVAQAQAALAALRDERELNAEQS